MTKRTQAEINAYIERLKAVKPRVPHHTMFNDDNWAKIDAQIRVLERDMSETRIELMAEEQDDPELYYDAMEARYWLDGGDADPLADWEDLAG